MSPKRKGKKRKKTPTNKPKAKDSDGFGTLAEQLKSTRRALRTTRRTEREEAEAQRRAEIARRKAAGQTRPEQPKRKLTQDQLMAEAFQALGGEFSNAEKYTGDGFDASNVEVVEDHRVAPTGSAPADGLSDDDLLFAEMMAADVQRIDNKKAALREKSWSGVRWRTAVEINNLTAADLERLELSPAQRDLLKRSRKVTMQVVKLRYLRKHEALADMETFVRGCFGRGERFARVIHGKGRQSKAGAVIKPAIVAWCAAEGAQWVRAWAPEIDQTGQFGSLVIELRRRTTP